MDDRFLLVLDELTDLYWLSSVQLYYQLPFEHVERRLDGGVVSRGEGVNVLLATSVNINCSTAPQRIGPDVVAGLMHGFTTVRFDDYGESHTKVRCYATVAVPLGAEQNDMRIERPATEGTKDNWRLRTQVGDRIYHAEWMANDLRIHS